MNLPCPNCPAGSAFVVRSGHFFRRDDSRKIQCFKCKACKRYFSRATYSECYRQKKRRINEPLRDLLCKRLSLRDAARHFNVSRTTIDRRLVFLAEQARRRNTAFLEQYQRIIGPINKSHNRAIWQKMVKQQRENLAVCARSNTAAASVLK